MRMTSSKDLRSRNRSRVLRELLRVQESTRSELAAATGLSPATITNVLNDLVLEGLAEERGTVPSDGGRPLVRHGVRPEGAFLLGADVGEKGVAVELFDLTFERIDREFRDADETAAGPERLAAALVDAVTAIRARNPRTEDRLIGVGLGLPGLVEDDEGRHEGHGVVLHAQTLGWSPIHLDELVPLEGVPVFADNGAKTLAIAELWFGGLQDAEHGVVALLGRGVGLGIVSDRRILRGARSSAGEWGHTKIAVGGRRCRCGARGCIEAYLGADALLNRWRELDGNVPPGGWTALSALLAAAEEGDAGARQTIDEALDVLAIGLANVVNLLNPERVVVGGWVGLLLMRTHRDEIDRRIRAASMDRPASQFRLELCRFEGDSVALGAALLPLERLIESPLEVAAAPPAEHITT